MPAPDLKAYGCVLVKAGTILDRIKTFGPAVQVEGYDADGNRVEGITHLMMVEDATVSESKNGQPTESQSSPTAADVSGDASGLHSSEEQKVKNEGGAPVTDRGRP